MSVTPTSQVSLLDVTLRDGGYTNGHSWTAAQAEAVVGACEEARICWSEVGYYRPSHHATDGDIRPSASCPPGYLQCLSQAFPKIGIGVMLHRRDVVLADYETIRKAGVGLVRLPTQIGDLVGLEAHVAAAKAAGLTVSVNLIRVSEVPPLEVARAARAARRFGADLVYLADSNGSLFPEQVAQMVATAGAASGLPMGFHAHDGLSLAFINSLTALQAGCRYLDASLGGQGKGGGNLSLELITGYLRARYHGTQMMTPLVAAVTEIADRSRGEPALRCQSIASGLLDLNIDALRDMSTEGKEVTALIDAL
jgi:4-hydroxy 2-oxovalerate aldolase